MNDARDATGKAQPDDSVVVACVVFQTRDVEHLVQQLREVFTTIVGQVSVGRPASPIALSQEAPEDLWLKHTEAAEYLGISKSTLYQYACQQKIECRKLGGRLEYRRSILDRFKDLHIRPAQRWLSQPSIIPTALGSGK